MTDWGAQHSRQAYVLARRMVTAFGMSALQSCPDRMLFHPGLPATLTLC